MYKTFEMKKIVFIAFSLLAFQLFSQTNAIEWEDYGFELQKKELHKEAIVAFSNAISMRPSEFSYGGRALSYENIDDYENALHDYSMALSYNPNSIFLLSSRGRVYGELGKGAEGLNDLNKALALDTNNTEVLLNKVIILYSLMSKPLEAKNIVEHVIQQDSTIALAYYHKGKILGEYYSDLDGAISAFDKAIEIDNSQSLYFQMRARAKRLNGDIEGALKDYSQSIFLYPPDYELYNERGLIYVAKQDYKNAYQDFDKSVQLNDSYSEAYQNRGVVKFYLSKNGCEDLKKAKELGHPKAQAAINELCR